MASYPYQLVDVFTAEPFAGNQLAVFPRGQDLDEPLLSVLARELNLSETVFVFPPVAGGDCRLRILTSWCELPFAGHPVLGAACLIARNRCVVNGRTAAPETEVRVETGRGLVIVAAEVGPGSLSGWMDQPLPVEGEWAGDADRLIRVLGIPTPVLPVALYDNGVPHLYLMLDSRETVLAISPDFAALRQVCAGARINCFAGGDGRYTSRMFSPFDPALPEDPACGSAAGPLAVHLMRHGLIGSGSVITISQGEQVGRPSDLLASAQGTATTLERVAVGGSVCLVGHGAFDIA